MTEKYDIRGNIFRVKRTLDDGTVLGFVLYENPETGEEMEDSLQVIGVQLYDQSPRQKVESVLADLQEKVTAARNELSRLTKDVREAEAVGKARLAKLSQYDQLKRLEDFLDGKITHYVVSDYYPPKIVSIEDATCESGDRDRKLLCLFGTPKRTLEWKLNRYSDGSGNSHFAVPCCGLEEAKQVQSNLFSEHFAGREPEGWNKNPQRSWLDAADKAGIAVPEQYRAAVLANEQASREKEIADLEKKLKTLRGTA